MANWKAPKPKDTWSDKEWGDFGREIWTRLKFFYIAVPAGKSVPPAGVTGLSVTTTGGGGDIETDLVLGLRRGMPVKLTNCIFGGDPPPAGLTWDCAVMGDDSLSLWWMNFSVAPVAIADGDWAVMGVVL